MSKEQSPAPKANRRRFWTAEERKQLEDLCALRPHIPWTKIGKTLGRTPAAVKYQSLEMGIRRGGHPQALEVCHRTGIRKRWGVPGCDCQSCEARRSRRRGRKMFQCAGCGDVNLVVGSGAKQQVHLMGNAPPEMRP